MTKKNTLQKQITHAGENSVDAKLFGFGETGCYTIDMIIENTNHFVAVAGFSTYDEAKAYADKIDAPSSKYCLSRIHN